ncbi:MAG: putative electron transfer oxidoreductase [Myxococcales bacterium]|nr:putative electron transfer oxidoreductase [Myxococcales bacterium]
MRNTAVIIGAGPGGAAAAVRLAQRGVKDIVLVDKDRFPREKTCGSALSPNGLKIAEELGIGVDVKRLGYHIHSLVVVTPGKRQMHLRTTEGAAVVLLRKHFDNLLVERAKALGVQFRSEFRATELVRDGGGRVVGVRGKDDEIHADYVVAADGAHSIFSNDQRPKRTISTLMGWWEGMEFAPGTMEMIFDKNLSPLYGWMFPETDARVNIGICMDGEGPDGRKTERNVRDVFARFLEDHYASRLAGTRQIGKLKGHPISYTTWIRDCSDDGILFLGEAARITHNATGEGIFQAMQSGMYAADAVADVVSGRATEAKAWAHYTWQCRQRFTFGFVMGHVLRGALKTPLFDAIALAYNSPSVKKVATWALGSALAGSHLTGSAIPDEEAAMPSATPSRAAAN